MSSAGAGSDSNWDPDKYEGVGGLMSGFDDVGLPGVVNSDYNFVTNPPMAGAAVSTRVVRLRPTLSRLVSSSTISGTKV